MYTAFYGFKEKPFKLVPDPRFLYMSEAHKTALSHLQYGIEDRNGFVVITGEVGSGKTLLLRVLMNSLPASTQVARVINTNFNAQELLEHVLNEFGVEVESRKTKPQLLSMLTRVLLTAFAEKKEAILVIDEAQNLSINALEELRMISNLETNTEKLVQIVMVGQPQLRHKLNLPILEQLKQRITVQYHLGPLNEQECAGYVNHRLKVAGGAPMDLFAPEALKLIYDYAGGIPRLINVISDAALRLGYVEGTKRLDEKLLHSVMEELQEIGDGAPRAATQPRQVMTTVLDQNAVELNRKFQDLYNRMQSVYAGKGEESLLLYEQLLNVEKEQDPKKQATLKAREEMLFSREQEIHRKLLEVSTRLNEVNAVKESLEEKKIEIQNKVLEVDQQLRRMREWKSEMSSSSAAGSADQLLKQKMEALEGIQQRLQERETDLNDKMEELRSILQELEQKKVLLDHLGSERPMEERLKDLEKQQALVRRKAEELMSRLGFLEKEIRTERKEKAQGPPPGGSSSNMQGIQDQEFRKDLIHRVERLKSDIDTLGFQKKLFHASTEKDDKIQSRLEKIERQFSSLQKKEERLLSKIENIQESSRLLENKTFAVDEMTEKVTRRDRLLEKKLGELYNLILAMERKDPLFPAQEVRSALPVLAGEDGVERTAGLSGAEPAGKASAPGRRFNMLIREILKGS
ncbi:MAG: AAA family ATPase [Deltaproteobacteria bacterium]|nr:AAA family ATPase [Deltaproteobacteria bacterium]